MDGQVNITHKPSLLGRVRLHIRGRLVAGLVFVIPIAVTFLIFSFALGLVDGFFTPLSTQLSETIPGWVPEPIWISVLSIILTLVGLYAMGIVAHNFIGRRLIRWGDGIIGRVPVIRGIYSAAVQATDLFAGENAKHFSRVVLVEFPRVGVKSLGFVTGQYHYKEGDQYTIVYIPTVPNPTSGFMVFLTEDQIMDTGMDVEMAMKIVLSGGLLTQQL